MTAMPDRDDVATLETGLDALESVRPVRVPLRERLRATLLPPIIAAAVLLTVWAALAASGIKPPELLPPPSDVWAALRSAWDDGTLQAATWASVSRAAVGFTASVVLGTLLGLLLSQWRGLRTAIGPLVSGLQSLPAACWVPAGVLWFGVSDAAVYVVVLFGAIPSIALGLVSGIDRVPPQLIRAGRVLGAGRAAQLRYVVLPAALPGYVSGLRLGWAFAWRSLMAAELIIALAGSPSSLGQLLDLGRKTDDMGVILAVIVVILVVGVAIEAGLFGPLEKRLLRSRGLGTS